jgi:hypothetical protein
MHRKSICQKKEKKNKSPLTCVTRYVSRILLASPKSSIGVPLASRNPMHERPCAWQSVTFFSTATAQLDYLTSGPEWSKYTSAAAKVSHELSNMEKSDATSPAYSRASSEGPATTYEKVKGPVVVIFTFFDVRRRRVLYVMGLSTK